MGSSEQPVRRVRGSHRERRAATRAKVLDAGILCLSQHGYHATTTSLVAKTAGVSRGALLHQFPTRLDLIIAIGEFLVSRYENLAASVLGTMKPGLEQFKGLTEVLWEKNKRDDTIAFIEIYLAARNDAELTAGLQGPINKAVREQMGKTRQIAADAGIDEIETVDALAVLTLASMWGMAILELGQWDRKQIDDAYALLKNNRDQLIAKLLK